VTMVEGSVVGAFMVEFLRLFRYVRYVS